MRYDVTSKNLAKKLKRMAQLQKLMILKLHIKLVTS